MATGPGAGINGRRRLLGPALVFLGLVGALGGVVSTVDAARAYYSLHPRDVVATATVTRVLSRAHGQPAGPSSRVMVEFVTLGGPVKEAVSAEGVKVGARLNVTYDRKNPAAVKLASEAGSPDLWPGLPILLGGLFTATIGTGLVWTRHTRQPGLERLPPTSTDTLSPTAALDA